MRRQASAYGKPRGRRCALGLLPGSRAHHAADLMPHERSIQAKQAGPPAGRALAVLLVDGDAPNSLTARWFELVTCCAGGPWRQQPPRQRIGHVGEDGHGEACVGPSTLWVPSVGGWADDPRTVVGPSEVP